MRFYQKIIISFLLLVNSIQAQQYPVKNISTQDGLINNSIQSVYKDSRGTLWVGTSNGLSKIENNEIQNLTIEDGIAHNSCWAIIEDINHNMWFGSYGGGITFFDGKKLTIFNKGKGLVDNFVRKLFSYQNKIFVGTDNGFSIVDINSKKIENYSNLNKKEKLLVTGFFEYGNEIYVGTFSNGLWKVNENKKLEHFNKKVSVLSIQKINDSIKCFSDFNLKCFSIKDFLLNKKNAKEIKSSPIWDIIETNDKQTFLAVEDFGSPIGGVFKLIKSKIFNYNKFFNIDSNEVWCLFYDKKNNQLYIGTSNKGLFIVDLSREIDYYNLDNEDIKYILKTSSSSIFTTSNTI